MTRRERISARLSDALVAIELHALPNLIGRERAELDQDDQQLTEAGLPTHMSICAYIHTCIHTHVYVHILCVIHTCVHANKHIYMHTRIDE